MARFIEVASGDRSYIVPEDNSSAWMTKQPDPSPTDIRLIEAHGCPVGARRACIYIDSRNVTSVCRHLGPYPGGSRGASILNTVACKHPDISGPLVVHMLITFVDCFIKQGLCIGLGEKCESLKDVLSAPGGNKQNPHYCISCAKLEEGE